MRDDNSLTVGHQWPVRVYYEDTDAGDIVYHANYLKFAERARTEWLRDLGIEQSVLRYRHHVLFVVSRCDVQFKSSARLDDSLIVESSVVSVMGASLQMRQKIRRGDKTLVSLDVWLACVDEKGRVVRLPWGIRDLFLTDSDDSMAKR